MIQKIMDNNMIIPEDWIEIPTKDFIAWIKNDAHEYVTIPKYPYTFFYKINYKNIFKTKYEKFAAYGGCDIMARVWIDPRYVDVINVNISNSILEQIENWLKNIFGKQPLSVR